MRYAVAALLLLAALACAAVLFRRQLFDRLAGLSPTTPDQPGDDDREASGADEEFGDELRAMRAAPVAPELVSPSEQMLADHEALNTISTALDDFDRTVSDAISRFLRNQPTVLLRLPASVEQTGEYDVRELDALLAGAA